MGHFLKRKKEKERRKARRGRVTEIEIRSLSALNSSRSCHLGSSGCQRDGYDELSFIYDVH